MVALLSKQLQWLAHQEWPHKTIRTLLVVVPGLSFFVTTGDQRGVMLASPPCACPFPMVTAVFARLISPVVLWSRFS
jgi:hypothetical protein